jgi:hypothetical protein
LPEDKNNWEFIKPILGRRLNSACALFHGDFNFDQIGQKFSKFLHCLHSDETFETLATSVGILKADDIILTQIATGLHLNHLKRHNARVFQAVRDT